MHQDLKIKRRSLDSWTDLFAKLYRAKIFLQFRSRPVVCVSYVEYKLRGSMMLGRLCSSVVGMRYPLRGHGRFPCLGPIYTTKSRSLEEGIPTMRRSRYAQGVLRFTRARGFCIYRKKKLRQASTPAKTSLPAT